MAVRCPPFPCHQFCYVYWFCLHTARRTLCATPAQGPQSQQAVRRIRMPSIESLALPRTMSSATSAFSIRPSRCSSFYHCGLTRYQQPHQCLAPAGQPHGSIACRQLSRITTSETPVLPGPHGSQKVCRVFQCLSLT